MTTATAILPTLTAKQAAVLEFIREYATRNGYAPAVRDICDQFDWTPNGAMGHLRALRAKGRVDWTPGKARTLHVTDVAPRSRERTARTRR